MALGFDDRILGEKVNNYISSDDESDEPDSGDDGGQPEAPPTVSAEEPVKFQNYNGHAANTGPKGVLNDYEAFQKMERKKARETEKLKVELAKKCTLSCRTVRDDDDAEKLEAKIKEELDAHEDDFENEVEREFLEQYRKKRIEEMRNALASLPRFGNVIELTRATFVKEIDESVHQLTTVIVLIYADSRSCDSENALACGRLLDALDVLAREYTTAKVCRIEAREANVSKKFVRRGVPALLVYKHGELIGNFVAVHRELGAQKRAAATTVATAVVATGDTFSDLETLLLEYGYLPERSNVLPQLTQTPLALVRNNDHEDASDEDGETKSSKGRMQIFQYKKRVAGSDSDDSD